MKRFVLSLATLAALSTAAFASYRDVTTPYGNQDQPPFATAASPTLVVPLAAPRPLANADHPTSYQQMLINSEEPGSSTR